jgi:hypothetical protein
MLPKVRSRAGTPVASDFSSADGSPLVQNNETGEWWGYANGVPYPIAAPNVKGAGATGDGTTDDTTKVQNAITAAAGGMIVFPAGTYLVSGLTIPANTTLWMYGATIKQKVLATTVGTAIFNVTGPNVTFLGGTIDGQKASQPADTLSDSFANGSGYGRSYRAAIKANAVTSPTITDLTVRGVSFKDTFGACVACLDVPVVRVQDCRTTTCKFELAYLVYSATQGTYALVTGNIIDTCASGDATVNSDGAVIQNYRRAIFANNAGRNIERCMVKFDGGEDLLAANNVLSSNTINNFAAIQFATTYPLVRFKAIGNEFYNVGAGITVSPATTATQGVIEGNQIHTTTGTNTGDGIRVDDCGYLRVAGNTLTGIKRHGAYFNGAMGRVFVKDNDLYGAGTDNTYGMLFSASSSWTRLVVRGNDVENFETRAGSNALVEFQRSAAFTYGSVMFQHNSVLTGSGSNRGVRAVDDCLVSGIFSDNYIDGQLATNTAAIKHRNNTVTGTVSTAAGSSNIEEAGATQTTVGAAGAASALPANPTGYTKRTVNGTTYVTPYYLAA